MDLNKLCADAVTLEASDIHLKVGGPPVFRIHGELVRQTLCDTVTNDDLGRTIWDIMTVPQRERFKATNECDLAWAVPGVARFRCNVFRQQGRIGAVLRAIPLTVRSIDDLALPAVLKSIATERRGLVLTTGATGSGKSTTLAALIQQINRTEAAHVLTIEDPIEFVFEDDKCVINQREIGVDSTDFETALRSALRQDPDVILIGELRDLTTVEIAMHAAETGHLVLGTLHTIDAYETINRLLGFFEPYQQTQIRLQLGTVLRAVISQRLVPTATGQRIAAVEVMLNTGTVAECVVDQKRSRELRDHIRKGRATYGMQTFDQHLLALFQGGKITQESAMRFAQNPDELLLRLSGLIEDD